MTNNLSGDIISPIVLIKHNRGLKDMVVNVSHKKNRKNLDKTGNKERSEEIRKIVAQESGIAFDSVHDTTRFMSAQRISYFDCLGILYVLQHRFNVSLPESSYAKYRTVGDLIDAVNRQSRKQAR